MYAAHFLVKCPSCLALSDMSNSRYLRLPPLVLATKHRLPTFDRPAPYAMEPALAKAISHIEAQDIVLGDESEDK